MIASARSWYRRNRTSLTISAGVLGAGYVASQYVFGKITETRQRMSDDRIAKENLRRRFEQNQEDCTFTVLAILPTATDNILEALPVEQTLTQLQRQRDQKIAKSSGSGSVSDMSATSLAPGNGVDEDGKSLKSFQSDSFVHASQTAESVAGNGRQTIADKPKSKAMLWNEMKTGSIARAFALIYTLTLLTLLTRIQLNLLGRRNYLASVVALAAPPKQGSVIQLQDCDDDEMDTAYGSDFDTNRKYLSLSWWLLHRGCKDIILAVVEAVEQVFGPVNPREDLSLERLSNLIVEVRKTIEGTTEQDRRSKRWLPFLLPSNQDEEYVLQASGMTASPTSHQTTTATNTNVTPPLRRLIDETSDLIDSPMCSSLLTHLFDAAFTHLVDDKISALAYKLPLTLSASNARVQELLGSDETDGTPDTNLTAKAKLANTLAVFCRQAHAIAAPMDNQYLAAIEAVGDLEAFAAVVYSSNFDIEAADALDTQPLRTTRPTTVEPQPQSGTHASLASLPEQGSLETAWAKAVSDQGQDK